MTTSYTPPPPTAVVIFGASGDLTRRKLLPALYNLMHDELLPEQFSVIGAARSPYTDETFREYIKNAVSEFSRRPIRQDVWDNFAKRLFYCKMDATIVDEYKNLQSKLESIGAAGEGNSTNLLYYLSASPEFFGPISENLKKAGLVDTPGESKRTTSVIIEKPFGHDLASAQDLNKTIRQSLSEQQIFRIDHYLGKETVQNILVFRFANGIFEPLWNHKYIDHIQISVCESIGVGSRAGYFEKAGIMRDIVQNHVMQLLSLLCIEPPISLSDASSIRDEKVKVLRSLKPMTEAEVYTRTVRGQYAAGTVDGEAVPGYRQEKGVSPESTTDTYIAMRLEIDNWRWFGVPIYVRAAKRVAARVTDITIFFKKAPHSLFSGHQVQELEQDRLTIRIQPNEGISLRINSKPPGPQLHVRPVDMDFSYGEFFGAGAPEAYERLLLDAMRGDSTLFIRDDEIEEAWKFLEPVFDAWKSKDAPPLEEYASGGWGPQSATRLLVPHGHRWKRLS